MSAVGKRMIRAAREAVEFSRLLEAIPMVDAERHTTVVVSKKGKIIGTVYGMKPAPWGKP